ncbi:hypothetical protein GCM10009762_09720 [Dermacoccus barathri]|uniref:Methyltransferase n=3 Tax=Dermacoccus barathri TaxID=322601 RepID=A0ABN2BDF1_9MICO
MKTTNTGPIPPGTVRDAVAKIMHDQGDDAISLRAIHHGVEVLLNRPVPQSSVRSALNLHTEDYSRAGRGMYRRKSTVLHAPAGSQEHEIAPVRATPPAALAERQIGNARLINADSLEWLNAQPECSVHGVVTDPPYGLVEYTAKEQQKLRSGRGGVWRIPPSFDGHQRAPLPRFTTLTSAELDQLDKFFKELGEALLRVLVPGGHILMAGNPLVSHRVAYALDVAGLERRGEIVRLVQTMRGGDRPKNAHDEFPDVSVMPRSQWEPWLLFRKPLEGTSAHNLRTWGTGGLRRISDEQPFGDVIRSAPTHRKERMIANHPSLKPQSFLRQVVRAILPLGTGVVLDPFAGSGSTLAAAEALGYRSVGIELDTTYFELATKAIPALASVDIPLHRSK